MKPYFFVPASKIDKLYKFDKELNIIIDFEDSILSNEIWKYIQQMYSIKNYNKYWFRIPTRDDFDDCIDFNMISKFVNSLKINKIILPKIISSFELMEVLNFLKPIDNLELIILIEHPRLFIEMPLFLNNENNTFIKGLGLGSHDLMMFLKQKHTNKNLEFPMQKLLYLAKAYNLIAIDIATMNIKNERKFKKQLNYAEQLGYNNKFLIHPNQLKWINEFNMKNKNGIMWAQTVMENVSTGSPNIEPFILKGEVIEKPHVKKAMEIIKKHNESK